MNEATSGAEMRYHLEFSPADGRVFVLEGRKYMQKDEGGGIRGAREVLEDCLEPDGNRFAFRHILKRLAV